VRVLEYSMGEMWGRCTKTAIRWGGSIDAQTGGPARHGTGLLGPTDNRAVPGRPACRSRGPSTARRPGSRAGPAR
jgi:hypothetical protein